MLTDIIYHRVPNSIMKSCGFYCTGQILVIKILFHYLLEIKQVIKINSEQIFFVTAKSSPPFFLLVWERGRRLNRIFFKLI